MVRSTRRHEGTAYQARFYAIRRATYVRGHFSERVLLIPRCKTKILEISWRFLPVAMLDQLSSTRWLCEHRENWSKPISCWCFVSPLGWSSNALIPFLPISTWTQSGSCILIFFTTCFSRQLRCISISRRGAWMWANTTGSYLVRISYKSKQIAMFCWI